MSNFWTSGVNDAVEQLSYEKCLEAIRISHDRWLKAAESPPVYCVSRAEYDRMKRRANP